ncbi:hypothetical protein OR1_03491 [Geobacter sp. OR-1]|uniref:DUF6531 domain-containing protein n=1 Tax=Geobacter sp. OR-1 TaxID=1266765 RepID=UPI000544216E|nr:DUF6531 domain-containing protein [Geobacter sp. OR-1]GAM11181.1 hypothetical protein OR1_03491 [Geobacter sp. OR-1]
MKRLLNILMVTVVGMIWLTALPVSAEMLPRTGDYRLVQTDLGEVDNQGTRLTRYYHSSWTEKGMFGPGWITDFDLKITVEKDGSLSRMDPCTGEKSLFLPDKGAVSEGEGAAYTSVSCRCQQITVTKSGYLLTSNDRRENYSADGLLQSVTYNGGSQVNLVRDKGGRVVELNDASVGDYTLSYGANGFVSAVHLGEELIARYCYTPNGRLASASISGELEYVFDYDQGLITHLAYNDSEEWVDYYSSDKPQRVKLFRTSEGSASRYTYRTITPDALTYLVTVEEKQDGASVGKLEYLYTDRLEGAHRFLARLVESSDGEVVRETTYNSFMLPLEVKSNGQSRIYRYDERGRVIYAAYPQALLELDYDPASGKVSHVRHVDREDGEEILDTYYRYDGSKNLIKAHDSSGKAITLAYGARNKIITIEEGDTKINFRYGRHDRLERVEVVGVGVIDTIYDDIGNMLTLPSENGESAALKVTETFNTLMGMTKEAEVRF